MHDDGNQILLTHCGEVRPQVDWQIGEHSHSDVNQMIYVLQGQIETKIDGQVLIGQRGDVLWYPRGVPHAERAIGGKPLHTIFTNFAEVTPQEVTWPLITFDRDGRIEQQLRWIFDLFPANNDEGKRIMNLLMYTAAYEYRQQAQRPQQSEMVLKIKRYIRKRISDPISLDDLASEAGLSRFYFARAFREEAGMSPMSFLRKLRVEAAQSLILRTPLPLKSIATQVGFADEFHFSRVFHQVTGQAPGAYRKRA